MRKLYLYLGSIETIVVLRVNKKGSIVVRSSGVKLVHSTDQVAISTETWFAVWTVDLACAFNWLV